MCFSRHVPSLCVLQLSSSSVKEREGDVKLALSKGRQPLPQAQWVGGGFTMCILHLAVPVFVRANIIFSADPGEWP